MCLLKRSLSSAAGLNINEPSALLCSWECICLNSSFHQKCNLHADWRDTKRAKSGPLLSMEALPEKRPQNRTVNI